MADSNLDIWRLQAQADTQGLIQALQHSDPEIRRRAAMALRALGATSAIPALQATLVDERDTDIRSTILSVLDFLFEQEMDEDGEDTADEAGQPHQVVYWIAQLTSDKAEQIIHAAQYLAEAKEKIAVETLILVFRNAELPSHARLAAAEALIKLESAPVEVTLLAALRHPDWRTRRNAAAVLAQISADWAVEPLTVALHDDNEMVRKTAFAALKHLGTPEALEALQPPVTMKSPPVQPPPQEPQLLAAPGIPAEPAPSIQETTVQSSASLPVEAKPPVPLENSAVSAQAAELAGEPDQPAAAPMTPVVPAMPTQPPVAPTVPADQPKPSLVEVKATPPVPAQDTSTEAKPALQPPTQDKPLHLPEMTYSVATEGRHETPPDVTILSQGPHPASINVLSVTVEVSEPVVSSPAQDFPLHDEEDTRPMPPLLEDDVN